MNTIKYLILWLLFSCSIVAVNAQNTLYLHSNQNKSLYLADLDNCKQPTIVGQTPEIMYDIAMSPNGQLFGISSIGNLYSLKQNGSEDRQLGHFNSVVNALVYGPNDSLYAADNEGQIFVISPVNGKFTNLGRCGYPSAGDLTFYEGKLYLSAEPNLLVNIVLPKVENSKKIGTMMIGANSAPRILGLITVGASDCQGLTPKIYATGENTIYEVNISNAQLNKKCTYTNVSSIGGAASLSEASKFQKKYADKDSTFAVCFGLVATVDLINYLPKADKGGKWNDIDKSLALTSGQLKTQSLRVGSYRFQYTVGDGLCADVSIVTVKVNHPIIDKLTIKNSGCDSNTGEIEVTVDRSYTSTKYSIDPNAQVYQNGNVFKALKPADYTIRVQTVDGCQTDSTVHVGTTNAPVITAVNVMPPRCYNDVGSVDVLANGDTGSLNYSLDNGQNFQKEVSFKNVKAAQYTVVVKDSNNCLATKPTSVTQPPELVLSALNVSPTTCGIDNGSVKILANGGTAPLTYKIDTGTDYQTGNLYNNLRAGQYQLFVKDINGCVTNKSAKIDTSSSPKINSVRTLIQDCGLSNGEIVVDATGSSPLSYAIENGLSQAGGHFENLESNTYKIVVKDANGCPTHSTAKIEDNCTNNLSLPTSFSPNNDLTNDTWTVYFPQKNIYIRKLILYNRWGQVIYSITDLTLQNGATLWNGQVDGKPVTDAVYNYILEVDLQNGNQFKYRGFVTILSEP